MEDVTLHDVLNAINEYATKTDTRLNQIDGTMNQLAKTMDRLAVAVVNLEERMTKTEGQIKHLTEQHDLTFRRIDDFLHILNTHESEIAAVRHAYQRMDERVEALETKFARA